MWNLQEKKKSCWMDGEHLKRLTLKRKCVAADSSCGVYKLCARGGFHLSERAEGN